MTSIIPIGTRVRVERDNGSGLGVVVDWRPQEPCYEVQQDRGGAHWFFSDEVTEAGRDE